jgi:hypothetical protein
VDGVKSRALPLDTVHCSSLCSPRTDGESAPARREGER